MKIKKLLISAGVVAASSGLLATVLTSCAKQNIDKDLRIDLDDEGKFLQYDFITDNNDFRGAIKNALKMSSTWAEFKEALAKEIVYQWFVDRASSDDHKDRNDNFKNFINRSKLKINDDYKEKVDSYKSKYGANHPFYLQNELLSKNGGTETSYKHIQLVDAIKNEFIEKVFDKDYFGMRNGDETNPFPHFFTTVNPSETLDENTVNNPENWTKFGFYAKSNREYTLNDVNDPDKLAKYPDGDYATLQNYVFNRWFDTEKPFFSAAALFKYGKPKTSGEIKDIYNTNKIPTAIENLSDSFPFFGLASEDPKNGYKGIDAFWHWNQDLLDGVFESNTYDTDAGKKWNQTINIPLDDTEDSQSLLLCYGSQMFGGSEGGKSLYIPYAAAAGSLYNQMINGGESSVLNVLTDTQENPYYSQQFVNTAAGETEPAYDEESPSLLQLFFYRNGDTLPNGVKSYIDLEPLYGKYDLSDGFHSLLFVKNENFNFFYGDTDPNAENHNGIRYVTNTVQANLGKKTEETYINQQPWVFELNTSGMHAQTIDGYQYVTRTERTEKTKLEALKNVVKYRLMQIKCGYAPYASASVLGSSGDLKSYFEKNFANIVLEMALSTSNEENIFRKVESYKTYSADSDFIAMLCSEQKLVQNDIVNYIKATTTIDTKKKNYEAMIAANDAIFAYHSKQIAGSKYDPNSGTIFDNGLMAPMTYEPSNSPASMFGTTHLYSGVTDIVMQDDIDCEFVVLKGLTDDLSDLNLIKSIDNVDVDKNYNGFSPQIKSAKSVLSNRFWFYSYIVDKALCRFMDGVSMANSIKMATYKEYYTEKAPWPDGGFSFGAIENSGANGITSAYKAKKVLTTDKNIASYTNDREEKDYFGTINNAYNDYYLEPKKTLNGAYCDEALQEELFYATIAWLATGDKPFGNFYNVLDQKIKNGERSYIAYLTKYNDRDPWIADPKVESTLSNDPYVWKANVAAIFDPFGYGGGVQFDRPKQNDFTEYWNVVYNKFTIGTQAVNLGGFLGIQTPNNNQLDSGSGITDAAFTDSFSKAAAGIKTVDTEEELAPETGMWFPWACGEAGDYSFKDVTWKDHTISYSDFNTGFKHARKLAQMIAKVSSPEDARSLATKLGNALTNKNNIFADIGKGEAPIIEDPSTATDQIKYFMLEQLLNTESKAIYEAAFTRISNAELRRHDRTDKQYCFFNPTTRDGYKLMFTQINKDDVEQRRLAPKYEEGQWYMMSSPLTLEEFWFIFMSIANESTYQQEAIRDAVKCVYGADKLVVHDAQLYNQFDSIWIKDWKKKPIGE